MSLRRWARDSVPLEYRRQIRVWLRTVSDRVRGLQPLMALPSTISGDDWLVQVQLSQPLGTTPHADAKTANTKLAAKNISSRVLAPGSVFSFWAWVGAPSADKGYLAGRALRDGQLNLETGGGLCQLAGALYFAGLQAGLEIVERHPHSIDLYTDETRYTPLGSDATVLFGFKDLRLRNTFPFPVAFQVQVRDDQLFVSLVAPQQITSIQPEFRIAAKNVDAVSVETWIDGTRRNTSRYKRHPSV